MGEELYVCMYQGADGKMKSWKCVKSQLYKTNGKCPITGRQVLNAQGQMTCNIGGI